jgi:hypothetical protein
MPATIDLDHWKRDLSRMSREIEKDAATHKQLTYRAHVENTSPLRAILGNLCDREPPVLMSGPLRYRLATPLGGDAMNTSCSSSGG